MKKVLLAVTGSISAYKSIELARNLIKNSYELKVIFSAGSLKFVNPDIFKYLGAKAVYLPQDDFNQEKIESNSNVLHISLARWCDLFIAAPLSANTLSYLAQGSCQDLMQSVFLSLAPEVPKILFPAMNTQMYLSPLTQKNIESLKLYKNTWIIEPNLGELACGEVGAGKLPEVEEIIEIIETVPRTQNDNVKNILISTGATRSYLDPVRYLTNPASGKTGYLLAKYFLRQGYRVHLIKGQTEDLPWEALKKIPHFSLEEIITTAQLLYATQKAFKKCDIFISAIAPCDFEFNYTQTKIKKHKMPGQLSYQIATDVLKEMINQKTHQKVVGFAAETHIDLTVLEKKWRRKPVDLLIGNIVHNGLAEKPGVGFQADANDYYFYKNHQVREYHSFPKSQLGQLIEDSLIESQKYNENHQLDQ